MLSLYCPLKSIASSQFLWCIRDPVKLGHIAWFLVSDIKSGKAGDTGGAIARTPVGTRYRGEGAQHPAPGAQQPNCLGLNLTSVSPVAKAMELDMHGPIQERRKEYNINNMYYYCNAQVPYNVMIKCAQKNNNNKKKQQQTNKGKNVHPNCVFSHRG